MHWGQPHVWREISRYQMRNELEESFDFSRGVNHFQLRTGQGDSIMSHDEEVSLVISLLKSYIDIHRMLFLPLHWESLSMLMEPWGGSSSLTPTMHSTSQRRASMINSQLQTA